MIVSSARRSGTIRSVSSPVLPVLLLPGAKPCVGGAPAIDSGGTSRRGELIPGMPPPKDDEPPPKDEGPPLEDDMPSPFEDCCVMKPGDRESWACTSPGARPGPGGPSAGVPTLTANAWPSTAASSAARPF